MSCLMCFPMSSAKLSKGMSSRINPMSFFQYLSNGFDAFYLSWFSTVSFCQCLIMRILLMSSRTELLRLLADVFLVSSIDVFHEVSPNVFCQSI